MPKRMTDPIRTHLAKSLPKLDNPACHTPDLDPDLFFPESAEEYVQTREAIRKICGGCPARVECLAYAIDNNETYGIWGGMNNVERSRITHRVPSSSQAKEILYQIRALLKAGMTVQESCSDLGISTRTYERYCKWEKTNWTQREQRPYYKSQQQKDTQ